MQHAADYFTIHDARQVAVICVALVILASGIFSATVAYLFNPSRRLRHDPWCDYPGDIPAVPHQLARASTIPVVPRAQASVDAGRACVASARPASRTFWIWFAVGWIIASIGIAAAFAADKTRTVILKPLDVDIAPLPGKQSCQYIVASVPGSGIGITPRLSPVGFPICGLDAPAGIE